MDNFRIDIDNMEVGSDDNSLIKCHICGEQVKLSDTHEVSGDKVCSKCVEKSIQDGSMYQCHDCGRLIRESNYIWMDNYRHGVCQNCYENTYTECVDCGSFLRQSDAYNSGDGETFCGDCYYEHYFNCEGCGNEYSRNEACWDDSDECDYCNRCYNDRNSNVIKDYHTMKGSNNYKFFSTSKDEEKPLFFGFELEVDTEDGSNRDDIAEGLDKILNTNEKMVSFEYDGSLSRGFEIISQPMTLEYLKSKKDIFAKAFSYLNANGYTSHDNKTCGLHIHFSRDYFGNAQQKQLEENLLFLSEIFKSELQAFCRRNQNGYAMFLSDMSGLQRVNMKKMTSIKKAHKGERYQVFNFQNDKTIEFRLPKGTLNLNTLIATVEFLNNFVFFANKKEADLLCLTWSDIITKNKTKNQELIHYAMGRRLMSSDTIVNFGAIDTIDKLSGAALSKVMKKAEKKGARMDLTIGVGSSNINPSEYHDNNNSINLFNI